MRHPGWFTALTLLGAATLACAGNPLRTAYVIQSTSVTWNGHPLPNADPQSFETLAHPWGRDARQAYYRQLVVPEAEPAPFVVVDEDWARDDRRAYRGFRTRNGFGGTSGTRDASSVKSCELANPPSFHLRPDGLPADDQRVYTTLCEVVTSRRDGTPFFADPKTFTLHPTQTYAQDDRGVWYGQKKSLEPLYDADPDTWQPLERGWSRDARRVWRRAELLDGADAATWEVVYVSGVDQWSRDQSSVWYVEKRLEGANPSTFERLRSSWGRDDQQVWWQDQRLDGADAASFSAQNEGFATDTRSVWYQDQRLEHLDPSTFRIIQGFIVADATAVYQVRNGTAEVIEGADPGTLRPHSNRQYYLVDRSRIWYGAKSLDLSPDAHVMHGYAWDDRRAYYADRLLDDADVTTLETVHNAKARDGRGNEWSGWTLTRRGNAP